MSHGSQSSINQLDGSPERTGDNSQSIFMTNLPNNLGLGPENAEAKREYTMLSGQLMSLAESIDSHYRK